MYFYQLRWSQTTIAFQKTLEKFLTCSKQAASLPALQIMVQFASFSLQHLHLSKLTPPDKFVKSETRCLHTQRQLQLLLSLSWKIRLPVWNEWLYNVPSWLACLLPHLKVIHLDKSPCSHQPAFLTKIGWGGATKRENSACNKTSSAAPVTLPAVVEHVNLQSEQLSKWLKVAGKCNSFLD